MSELKKWSQQELVDCAKACKERAEKDVAFRELLSKDPVKAIKEVTGKEISAECIKELSEAELEMAVGGGCGAPYAGKAFKEAWDWFTGLFK